VLLTSGAFDGTVPLSHAAEAAKALKNATHLVFPGIGHSASRWSPACFALVMSSFLDQPSGGFDQLRRGPEGACVRHAVNSCISHRHDNRPRGQAAAPRLLQPGRRAGLALSALGN
jgi:hypothetical protein